MENNMDTSRRLQIMLTNDDGIEAPGLRSLGRILSEFGEVTVVAPAAPQSGQSSALSVDKPLRIRELGDYEGCRMFSVSGTPVDCVKLGLHAVMPKKPDFIFSGTNHGSNSGNAITYSGTMGAVLEGVTVGIPSVGFSLLHHSIKADFDLSAPLVREIVAAIVSGSQPLPDYTGLNINIPAKVIPKGARVCRAARGHWSEEYERYLDPLGRPFYWLTGRFVNEEPEATDTDEYYLGRGYISIVPVTPEQTAFGVINDIEKLFCQLK